MDCCWHDTKKWWLDIDGAIIVQICCHCGTDREVGLANGFVIEGDREHGTFKPNYVSYRFLWLGRSSQVFWGSPNTRRLKMGGKPTLSDKVIKRIVDLGFNSTKGLRGFLHETKKEASLLPERKEDAGIVRKILRNRANIERFRQISKRRIWGARIRYLIGGKPIFPRNRMKGKDNAKEEARTAGSSSSKEKGSCKEEG